MSLAEKQGYNKNKAETLVLYTFGHLYVDPQMPLELVPL